MKTTTTYSQAELAVLLKARDKQAFSYLYDNYHKALFLIIYRIVKQQELAEDVLQNVFLKIWNGIDSYDSEKSQLYTWMLNIARNAAIDSLREKHEKNKSNIQEATDVVYYDNRVFVENTAHENIGIKGMISVLSDEHQEIIDLAYFQGFTQTEIATNLNIPLGTVKTKIRQAILELRKQNNRTKN